LDWTQLIAGKLVRFRPARVESTTFVQTDRDGVDQNDADKR